MEGVPSVVITPSGGSLKGTVPATAGRPLRRRLGGIVLSLLAAVAFATAYAQQWQESPVVFIYADPSPPISIDPAIANLDYDFNVTRNVYEGLTTYSPQELTLEPALATSWTQDGNTWTFTLRQGVKFHDGTDFTAEDVKVSIERMLALNQGATYLIQTVTSVEVVDDYTVRIATQNPDAFLPANLAHIGIVSADAVRAHEVDGDWAQAWFAENAAGTGPYALAEYRPPEQTVLHRFEDWWGGWEPGSIDEAVIRYVGETASRAQALERGDIDFANYLPLDDVLRIGNARGFHLVTGYEPYSFPAIYLNTQKAPTSDIDVRRAIRLAFSYDTMNQYYQGYSVTPRGPIPDYIPGSTEAELPEVRQDIEAAKALMAGRRETIRCIVPANNADFAVAATVLQASLAEIGIDVVLDTMPFAQMLQAYESPDTQPHCTMYGNANISPDPTAFLQAHFYTSGYYNKALLNDPEVDNLTEMAKQTFDEAVRTELLAEAQRRIVAAEPVIWTARPLLVYAVPDHVHGFEVDAADYRIIRLKDIRISQR